MISKNDLLKWIKEVDKRLKNKIVLLAVGGTAMTLLGLKPSTRDIDFCVKSSQKLDFQKACDDRYRVDLFVDGYIFSEQLPDDYLDIAVEIMNLKNVELKALAPVDIIITKAARLNARDEEDISVIAKSVPKDFLVKRFFEVANSYAGNEEHFKYHLEVILKRFYSGK